MPECLLTLRRRLEADLGHKGTREFIKVLRLLERATMRELTGAVEQALAIGATVPTRSPASSSTVPRRPSGSSASTACRT